LYESFSQEKLFLELDIRMKNLDGLLLFIIRVKETSAAWNWIVDLTWLATGSKIDSMVFVWNTGIFRRRQSKQIPTKNFDCFFFLSRFSL
jgi:hypothetical protein